VSTLTLDQATHILQAALKAARAAQYKPMGVVVLDSAVLVYDIRTGRRA